MGASPDALIRHVLPVTAQQVRLPVGSARVGGVILPDIAIPLCGAAGAGAGALCRPYFVSGSVVFAHHVMLNSHVSNSPLLPLHVWLVFQVAEAHHHALSARHHHTDPAEQAQRTATPEADQIISEAEAMAAAVGLIDALVGLMPLGPFRSTSTPAAHPPSSLRDASPTEARPHTSLRGTSAPAAVPPSSPSVPPPVANSPPVENSPRSPTTVPPPASRPSSPTSPAGTQGHRPAGSAAYPQTPSQPAPVPSPAQLGPFWPCSSRWQAAVSAYGTTPLHAPVNEHSLRWLATQILARNVGGQEPQQWEAGLDNSSCSSAHGSRREDPWRSWSTGGQAPYTDEEGTAWLEWREVVEVRFSESCVSCAF